jgi:hypothetical protein
MIFVLKFKCGFGSTVIEVAMAKAKLQLDDEGFEILGNALLLGYALKKMGRQNGGSGSREVLESRVEYSEGYQLREVLDIAGAYDRRLAGKIDANGGAPLEKFPDLFQRWADLANSDVDFATLRLREVDFISYLPAQSTVLRALEDASGYELRTPLAMLGPTELTRRVRELVLDYYSRDKKSLASVDAVILEELKNQQSNRSRRGFEAKDEPFVEFAIELLKSERANNPNDAMRMIEDRLWKEIAPDAESFEKAVAGGGQYDSKRRRLYDQVNKCWKEHPEKR